MIDTSGGVVGRWALGDFGGDFRTIARLGIVSYFSSDFGNDRGGVFDFSGQLITDLDTGGKGTVAV